VMAELKPQELVDRLLEVQDAIDPLFGMTSTQDAQFPHLDKAMKMVIQLRGELQETCTSKEPEGKVVVDKEEMELARQNFLNIIVSESSGNLRKMVKYFFDKHHPSTDKPKAGGLIERAKLSEN